MKRVPYDHYRDSGYLEGRPQDYDAEPDRPHFDPEGRTPSPVEEISGESKAHIKKALRHLGKSPFSPKTLQSSLPKKRHNIENRQEKIRSIENRPETTHNIEIRSTNPEKPNRSIEIRPEIPHNIETPERPNKIETRSISPEKPHSIESLPDPASRARILQSKRSAIPKQRRSVPISASRQPSTRRQRTEPLCRKTRYVSGKLPTS